MKYIAIVLALVLAGCERRGCIRFEEREVWIWMDQYTLLPVKQTVCTQWVRVPDNASGFPPR